MLKLTEILLNWMYNHIPQPPRNPKGGRPRTDQRKALAGILWILDNGAKWRCLPREFGSKSAVHRAFQRWRRAGVFERMLQAAGQLIERRGQYKLYECFIDGAFSPARGGGDGVGKTKAGKGVKMVMLVDAQGLPVAVQTASATPHEATLVEDLFARVLTKELPLRVIGDKAYDSDRLDAALAQRGVELIAPHRRSRRPERQTQDGRPLRRYRRRWTVERTFAWLRHFRRLEVRHEKSIAHFRAFLHMACTYLLLKQVLG